MAAPGSMMPVTTETTLPEEFFKEPFLKTYFDVDRWIRKDNKNQLLKFVKEKRNPAVNLSGELVLHVVIAYGKSDMALALIDLMPPAYLEHVNKVTEDTALHTAASKGNEKVAKKLVEIKGNCLLEKSNKRNETPLHKAAYCGNRRMFLMLEDAGAKVGVRTWDGNTVLHCAIMSNTPNLALYIAMRYPKLMESRNKAAVTPLQLLVTLPDVLRAEEQLISFEYIFYKLIPVDKIVNDEEELFLTDCESQIANTPIMKISVHKSGGENKYELNTIEAVDRQEKISARHKLPNNYVILFDILVLVLAAWKYLVNILRARYSRIEELCSLKEKHEAYMKLVAFMAHKPDYWDFILKGNNAGGSSSNNTDEESELNIDDESKLNIDDESDGFDTDSDEDYKRLKNLIVEAIKEARSQPACKPQRWNESPLTLGAKMGLHHFVEQILKVCPMSSLLSDKEGLSILQVAIKNRRERILDLIESMSNRSNNPVLSLPSLSTSPKRGNIAHFAAYASKELEYPHPLRLQEEMRWFTRVQELVPKDQKWSRDDNELTARELFSQEHKDMLQNDRKELQEIGKTYGGLVAAVVFASSFSIPGDKEKGKPLYIDRMAFKVFSHAYVIGLSCASTALVLFLSLTISEYREEDFKNFVPRKYKFALTSFFGALVALLVAFTCNIFLSLYGSEKVDSKLFPFVCELLILPAIVHLYLIMARGSSTVMYLLRKIYLLINKYRE